MDNRLIVFIINNIMNKELLDKIVSIHEEIENVKNKIKLVNGDDIPYVLYDNNSHLICSDRTIISDAKAI